MSTSSQQKTINSDSLIQMCSNMSIGDKMEFTLDHDPKPFETAVITTRINSMIKNQEG